MSLTLRGEVSVKFTWPLSGARRRAERVFGPPRLQPSCTRPIRWRSRSSLAVMPSLTWPTPFEVIFFAAAWPASPGAAAGSSASAPSAAVAEVLRIRLRRVMARNLHGKLDSPPVKVLCIDGGGIRGLIPALVLSEIERRTGRRTAELVDLVAGTSTGGILACALTRPGADGRPLYSADELAGIYIEEGPRIFHRSLLKRIFSLEGWVDERYDDAGLNAALLRYLADGRLSEALTDVLVTAYDIQDRFAFFFRSARARTDPTYDFPLFQVARATSAAPSYFEPAEATDVAAARTYPLIDGGIFAVNPSLCAYADVVAGAEELELMLSLG